MKATETKCRYEWSTSCARRGCFFFVSSNSAEQRSLTTASMDPSARAAHDAPHDASRAPVQLKKSNLWQFGRPPTRAWTANADGHRGLRSRRDASRRRSTPTRPRPTLPNRARRRVFAPRVRLWARKRKHERIATEVYSCTRAYISTETSIDTLAFKEEIFFGAAPARGKPPNPLLKLHVDLPKPRRGPAMATTRICVTLVRFSLRSRASGRARDRKDAFMTTFSTAGELIKTPVPF